MSKYNFYRASLLLVLSGIMAASCIKFEDKENETGLEAADTTAAVPALQPQDEKTEITSAVYIYNDTTGLPVKNIKVNAINASAQELVEAINKYTGNGRVILQHVKTSNDTVYVRIPNSAYLTQQMGTLGAHAYMATATYTLTEAPGIKHVDFDFEEGDHAAPGTYNRGSFKPEPLN